MMENSSDTIVDGAEDILRYFKENNYSIVSLTNWFTMVQVKRLERAGLLDYFDMVYGGDFALKPNREAFEYATYEVSDTIMIGDNYNFDVLPPEVQEMNVTKFREELGVIREAMLDVDLRINNNLEKNQKNKEHER